MEMETESAVLTEQRREIEEAKTLNSDLEFAFNLQMQEAMTASLSILNHPPSTASTSSLFILNHPPSTALASSSSTPKNEEAEVEDFDCCSTLFLENIERLEQERKDREESEHLMREMREDLDRRIHDQKVASEIMNIPDDEWEKYGDNYVDPFENGQRVSFFKMFCKGVESEERIRDMKVIVGGIGVAICDSKDNLIFKVSKGIDVGAEGSSSNKSCAGVSVELQALIEGLNAAFALDLKNLTFFVDHSMLYQYVTGTIQTQNSKISTLVNQVSLLQKKFADCKPSLVACSDIQFAFRFAKDAIVSQITWPADNGKGKGKLKETCVICYEDTDVYQIFSVDGCFHRYCFPCMKQHVEVKLLEGTMAKCPHEGCKSEVSIETCGKFLDPKLVEIMSQRKKETSIAVTEKVYCPYPRCSALMSKSELLEYTNSSFVGGEKCGARKCVKCHYFFCINCRVPWHYNMTCYDYKISKPHPRTEDKMLDSLAKRNRWRQCVMCKNMVELAEGCYHITCRCGYEFCYTCGAKWKNKKPTCSCPIWDERNIIRDR
ncbi:RBR-TYPE E3 UBIQUITIN TRANSFERASE [Salix viminalis]|uniref:RBR-type E3 ubiquitin transferase n=1 Tax=Salix viminalis TaxID=40686 RepID=A0A9Q0NKU5_SALVM|nr:RBR-TYPE E3 UBIQUITIN TRANSFERASE [Salix viminalis]